MIHFITFLTTNTSFWAPNLTHGKPDTYYPLTFATAIGMSALLLQFVQVCSISFRASSTSTDLFCPLVLSGHNKDDPYTFHKSCRIPAEYEGRASSLVFVAFLDPIGGHSVCAHIFFAAFSQLFFVSPTAGESAHHRRVRAARGRAQNSGGRSVCCRPCRPPSRQPRNSHHGPSLEPPGV